jgi:hypothetical protein
MLGLSGPKEICGATFLGFLVIEGQLLIYKISGWCWMSEKMHSTYHHIFNFTVNVTRDVRMLLEQRCIISFLSTLIDAPCRKQ